MMKPVYGRLRELDNYARNWEVGPFNPALLPSKVTPESESTIDARQQSSFDWAQQTPCPASQDAAEAIE